MLIRALLAYVFLTITSVNAASAATILYDFAENLSDDQTDLTYVVDGAALTVEAAGPRAIEFINRHRRGIGVSPGREGARLAGGESLSFTFDGNISSLVATIWERRSEDEDFAVFVNGIQTDFTILGGGNGQSTVAFDLSGLFLSETNTFSIVGTQSTGPGNRGILVSSIEVELIPVSLPAGGLLLATGFLGLAVTRRRKT